MAMSAVAQNSHVTHALQQLQVMRAVVWLAQGLSLLLVQRWLSHTQLLLLAGLLVVQLLLVAASHGFLLRAMDGQGGPGERSFFVQLLLDCVVLSALLYVAGGATNPFVSYYLVPIAVSAATLSRAHTAVLTAVCLAAYSLLLFYYLPLQALSPHEHHHGGGLSLHVLGMWLNFGLSAVLITHFVATIAATARRQREHINRLREQQLMDENILAVATLAAGAAHEMGTPLSSLSVLLADLRDEHRGNAALAADLGLMGEQVARCHQSLRQLADTAREHQDGGERRQPVAQFVDKLVRDWQVLRPEVALGFTVTAGPAVEVAFPLTVEQAIINVLDNAADAGWSLQVQVQVGWDTRRLTIDIADDGPGIAPEALQQRARLKPSSKGMGLGLLLSHASLERVGGTLSLDAQAGGGTLTRIILPLGEATNDG